MPIAVRVHAAGGPEALRPEEVSVSRPGTGEVQVEQSVIGVNFVDIYYRNGLDPLPSEPTALGFEGAGRVIAVGPGINALPVGDRVAYTGLPLGAYAAVRNLPEGGAVKLPGAISDRVAGSTMLRGITAHILLHRVHAVQPGDWILVHAAAVDWGRS